MKSRLFTMGVLFSSILMTSNAWSAQPQESAEECYRIMERFVNGSKIEVKDRFFRFQDHSFMKDLGGINDKTKPPTQYRSFLRSVANGQEQVTLQIFKDGNLPDQSKLPVSERVVRKFEVTHFQYANCTDVKNSKCFHTKKTFEMLDPQSKTCFKTITESNNLENSEHTLLSSKFCKKWDAYTLENKEPGTERMKAFLKKNPKWQEDFEHPNAMSSVNTLRQAVNNCDAGTASKSAKWEAEIGSVPIYIPVKSNDSPSGAK